MDGRRHSVDVPIAKALIALRRVRSLRDPSTNSMSKYSSVIENLNWETDSNNAITLGFQGAFHGNDSNGDDIQVWRSSNFTEEEKHNGDLNLYYGSRHSSPETVLGLAEGNRRTTPKKSLHAKQIDSSSTRHEKAIDNRGSSERCKNDYGNKRLEFTCVMPFDDCIEGSGSCNDPDETSKQIDGRREISKQVDGRRGDDTYKNRRKKHYRFAKVMASDDDIYGDSPCLSISKRSLGSISLYEKEDVLAMDSCHQGCGLSSCWSRTPKYRDINLLHDVEERPLLMGTTALTGDDWESKRKCEGVSPYTESPRSLCHKFMPKSFDELVGQSMVATSLLSAIYNRQISSLYIFNGPRGTGKTSASRIFAAALNCLTSDVKKPCGLCQECMLFFSGRSIDVKELDSLRLNKMERCRMLIKNAKLPPVCSRYKVYIIDECQMLHQDTWAHILNGLEDLPHRTVFVMLTPNLDKLPRNALSMSQKYHFQKLKDADIKIRLEAICMQEGVDFDQDALNFMATKSNGSLRDAEMMLDHLSLLGKKITMSLIYEVNGVISDDELVDLLYLALSSDATNTVKRARELMNSRIDPLQLISQLANLIMDILTGKCPVGVSEARRKIFITDNSEADMQQLSHALKILSQTEKQLRTSKNQSTWLTAALLQLSSPASLRDENGVRLSTRSINPPDSDFHSTSSTGESLKHTVIPCACERIESAKTRLRDLDLVWEKATSILDSRSLKKFLYRKGKLVSIRLMQGITVAELEFARPNHVSKAEKSWKVIASALQHILGYNVELRINLCENSTDNHGIFKKPSLGLLNCSRRVCLQSQFSAETYSVGSVNSDRLTPSKTVTSDQHKYVETTCSSDCGSSSQFSHTCCHARQLFKSIRNKDGNALRVGAAAVDARDKVFQLNEGVCHFNQESKPRKREYLKLHCWRSAMFPFRKAWNLKHQQRTEHLVDYAVHCAAAN